MATGSRVSALLWTAVAAAAALALYLTVEVPPETISEGAPAPEFELRSLDGNSVALRDLRGRFVFVNFWATWCKPCEDEMPAMERLYREMSGKPFEMVAISVDEDPELVRSFRDRLELTFPILLDPDKRVAGHYQSFRFPETYWIDEEGVLISRFIGPKEWDAGPYAKRLRELLP